MRRRALLQGLAGVALVPPLRSRSAEGRPGPRRIVVVGAGIVGAALSYRLAKRGADVTLFEHAETGAGATGKSFAWLNAHHSKQPRHYHELSRAGLLAWHALEHELGGLEIQWNGSLEWYPESPAAVELRELVPKLRAWGHPTRFLGRSELRAMEPQLEPGEVAAACWAELDGAVEPVRAARRMLDAALALGARLVQPCEVQGLSKATGAGLRVLTNRGTWQAESVVLAAGVETERLAALVGARVALKDAPGLLVHTAPLPRLLGHVIVGEKAHFKQYPDGRLVIGDDFGPPAAHPAHGMLAGHPRDFPDDSLRAIHARRILRQGSAYFETLAGAGVERVTIGWRPMPVDGYPVVGPLPGSPDVYAVVTHSGVTLAPLLAELVTSELLDRVDCELLHPYRPSRF